VLFSLFDYKSDPRAVAAGNFAEQHSQNFVIKRVITVIYALGRSITVFGGGDTYKVFWYHFAMDVERA